MNRSDFANGNGTTATALPPDAVERVTLEARKEGLFAGLTSGLASAVIGSRLFGFKRNMTLFCGVLSGALAGYMFTQAFRDTAMIQLRTEEARLLSLPQNTAEKKPDSEANSF
ncbi:hypothetical protein B0H34DRAFT_63062 [Crassisporium funariophilum]|nr:hypothetical protein B0H34DRAFT_63062 [Crassisporium funariophilum]